jgi:adenylyltransferase/sulfurtransferase
MSGSASLPRAVLDAIYAHAREGYPEEVCGLVIANDEARRCENRQNALHAEDPAHFPRDARTAYNLGAKDLFFLDKSLRSPRPVTLIYHSHVDVGAYFSDEDARAAAPDGELLYPVEYLVIDVSKDGVRGSKVFRFDGGSFFEVAAYGP